MSSADPARILTAEDCDDVLRRAHAFARGGGDTIVSVESWWQGELRWGRNRVSLASDRRDISIRVFRTIEGGGKGWVTTNQLDDASLEAAVRGAERKSSFEAKPGRGVGFFPKLPPYEPYDRAAIWSDATYDLTTEARGAIARDMIAPAESKGMISAGYLEVRAGAFAEIGTDFRALRSTPHAFWHQPYVSWTQAHCSTTVRDSRGTGSGWAGLSSFDWDTIDASTLSARALEKATASQNPVAIEPGRYTVILEPQAVADLMEGLVGTFSKREFPEDGHPTPWRLAHDDALQMWRTKLGLKVVDGRITITHDPADPRLGIVMHPTERPAPVTWIENGVLTALGHFLDTDVARLEDRYLLRGGTGYRISGGDTSVEEMISTTRRGLLVTRLSNIRQLDGTSLLSTGLTRDGLWLIENGRITKAVRNFRFTESPLFALNSIEQIGEPVPVFRPTRRAGGQLTPAIVPPLKVRDFSFTSLIDAV